MRLFISINLPPEIKSEIANLAKELNDPGIKKVSEENLHLTLKFLGEVDEKRAEAIKQNLNEISFKPFKISLSGIGFFPSKDYIKVVWVGVKDGREEIIRLQKEIDSALLNIGFPREKNFEPHLTIARVKFLKDHKNLMKFAESAKISASFEAKSFELMESVLKPGGPEYRVNARFELR